MGGAIIGKEFRTKFRVCDWSEGADGRGTSYGLGHLEPVTGILRTDSYYYELVADLGHLFWKAGRFVAHLNPQESPDFFTISAAA